MNVLIRAVQLGFWPESKLIKMAKDQDQKINLSDEEFNALDKQVCDRLDGFQRP